jgi:hypothetical protein
LNQKSFDEISQLRDKSSPNQKIWTQELAKKYGYKTSEALRSAFKRFRRKLDLGGNEDGCGSGEFSTKPEKIFDEVEEIGKTRFYANTEIKSDGSITSEKVIAIENEDLKNPSRMLELHGFDVKYWSLLYCKNNYWQMGSKIGEDGRITLYQSKITVKAKERPDFDKKELRRLFDGLVAEYRFPVFNPPKSNTSTFQTTVKDNLLLIGIADLHYALKSFMSTSNNEYNEEIAQSRFEYIIDDVIEKVKDRNIEKVVLFNGGDWFNCDNIAGTTTAGTPQSNGINYFDMVKNVTGMTIRAIDKLTSVAPVSYIYSLSNHDLHAIFSLALILAAWYKDNPNVTINTQTLDRYYTKYGNSCLGFAHDVAPKNAHKLMSEESGENWNCPFHYFFVAHKHNESVLSDGSVEIRRLASPSGVSEWAYKHGFIGTVKKSQSFIINKKYGLTDVINTVIEH